MTNLEKVKKFIKDNEIDLSGEGSDLNGACTALAGFICHVVSESEPVHSLVGREIINELSIPYEAHSELRRVFEYAWDNNYENFWVTEQAREEYIF